jgi:hypothetical protein
MLHAVECSKLGMLRTSRFVLSSPGLPRGNVNNWEFVV